MLTIGHCGIIPFIPVQVHISLFKKEVIVSRIEDIFGQREFCLHRTYQVLHIPIRQRLLCHQVANLTVAAVDPNLVVEHALIDEYRHMLPIGEHICTGQEPGFILKAPQIQNSGQDIHIAAVFIHHDRLFQTADPEDQRGLILGELIHFIAHQLRILLCCQTVGEVVAGHHDGCLVCNACFFQSLHQVFQCLVQLDMAAEIALGGIAVGQILDFIPVALGHTVAGPVIHQVSGEGHIVCVELLICLQVVVHRLQHHLIVRCGPGGGKFHTAAGKFHLIADVGVAFFPSVESAGIVMIAVALYALLTLKDIAQGKGQIAVPGGIEAGRVLIPGCIGIQTHTQGIFAVCGVIGEGVVVIVKHDTLVGQAVKSRCQLLVDGTGSKSLGTQYDEIVVAEHTGIFVLACSGKLIAVVIDGLDGLVKGEAVELFIVDLQHIVLRDFLDGFLWAFLGGFLGRIHGGLCGYIVIRLVYFSLNRGSLPGHNIQPQCRQQAKPLGGLVGSGGIVIVKIIVAKVVGSANLHRLGRDKLQQHRCQHQCRAPHSSGTGRFFLAVFFQDNTAYQGYKQCQHPGKVFGNRQ